MELVQSGFNSRIAAFKKEIASAQKSLEVLRKKQKKIHLSLFNRVEVVLRGAFHGGEFNGVHIIRIMNKASHIMGEIRDELIKHKRETPSEASINALCAEV